MAVSGAEAAGEPGTPRISLGETLPLWSFIPFVGMLLSIALMPLSLPNFWHHHYGKVSVFWAAAMGVPFVIAFGGTAVHEIVHFILADYVPFIILLWASTRSPAASCCEARCGEPQPSTPLCWWSAPCRLMDGHHRRGHAAYPALFTGQ